MLIGLGAAVLHAIVLRRAIGRVRHLAPRLAGRRLARGVPLRVLAWAPVLLIAARVGLVACLGLITGSLAGRWMTHRYYLARCERFVSGSGARGWGS